MKIFVLIITLILFNGNLIAGDSLMVINILPVPQSISAEPSATIEIQFNIRVDPSSFTDTSFMVWGRWSGVHKGSLDFNSIGTIAYFNPDDDFFFGEWVTVSLSKGIKDELGNNLSFGYAWNFWIITTKGSLDLTRTETIEVRQPGEDWIQTYGTYAGDLDDDGWSDFVVPNERPNDVRIFMNDGTGSYNQFTIFPIPGGARPSPNEGAVESEGGSRERTGLARGLEAGRASGSELERRSGDSDSLGTGRSGGGERSVERDSSR